MPAALPIIGAGLGIYSSIKGAQQQGRATKDEEQQLAQQQMIRNMVLGRLTQGPQGAVGNPFSQAYSPIQAPPQTPQAGGGWMGGIGDLLKQASPRPSPWQAALGKKSP